MSIFKCLVNTFVQNLYKISISPTSHAQVMNQLLKYLNEM